LSISERVLKELRETCKRSVTAVFDSSTTLLQACRMCVGCVSDVCRMCVGCVSDVCRMCVVCQKTSRREQEERSKRTEQKQRCHGYRTRVLETLPETNAGGQRLAVEGERWEVPHLHHPCSDHLSLILVCRLQRPSKRQPFCSA
jgi:hypothetical protein